MSRAMQDGFLGFQASFMLDVVVVALALIVPVLAHSIYAVKVRRRFVRHRNLQLLLGAVLLVAVLGFEADMRLQGGWMAIVNKGEPKLTGEQLEFVKQVLYAHLVFAVSTPILWIVTTVLALIRFAKPPRPGLHSSLHKTLGWLTTIDITLTSITGLAFYYFAFVRR
jgi:hypothetical protein